MSRRGSITSLIRYAANQSAKIGRERELAQKRQQREQERRAREKERQRIFETKEARARYIESRIEDVSEENDLLLHEMSLLQTILDSSLNSSHKINFEKLKRKETYPPFKIPESEIYSKPKPQHSDFINNVYVPNKVTMLIPGIKKKYMSDIARAEAEYINALGLHEKLTQDSERNIALRKEKYENEKNSFIQEVRKHNLEVEEFEALYGIGDEEAVTAYCIMILEQSKYPENFPKEFRLTYSSEPKEVVLEYELPTLDIIPKTSGYKYIKIRDEILETPQKPTIVKTLYQDIVASVCLRTIFELFTSDQGNWIEVVTFNGFTSTVDPSTGKDIRPCLISARVSREVFANIDLSRVDKKACLKNLGAQFSPRPDEMIAIKPVVTFDMVDKRFVQSSDVLSDLDSRPNIMELTPFEFEILVTNLFSGIGFDTKQTRSSRDGGVDAIAFDSRPLLGGKIILQAKRYKNVVGVSAVRDLYGTMINEGANKGILVTTSHYGPDAYTFANDKPIELIDGNSLLYLLKSQGIEAKIIMEE
ncbi:MAG: restriction endonuclease [Anaerolineaceae bacterium]